MRAGTAALVLVVVALWPCDMPAQTTAAPVFKTGVDIGCFVSYLFTERFENIFDQPEDFRAYIKSSY